MIKTIIRNMLPPGLRNSLSGVYRRVMKIQYRGNQVCCPICENTFSKFAPFGYVKRPNAKCPNCHSMERHRLLWLYFNKHMSPEEKKAIKVLHFAPENYFYDRFQKNPNIDYHPCDIDPNNYLPLVVEKMDITQISYPDNFFDLILCNHVLEHIPEVDIAFSELKRVLKNTGKAILDVPIDETLNKTKEDLSITDPKERLKLYGSPYHVRQYGNDYPQILEAAGFQVEVIPFTDQFSADEKQKFGLSQTRNIYIVSKN